jgi:hypothetical protein
VTGEVTVTESDVARGLAQLSLFRRRWLYLAAAALLVAFFLGLGHAKLSTLTPFLVFTALFQGYLFLGPRLMAKRTVAAMPDRTVRYRLDARELTITTTGSAVTRSWNRLTQFREDDTAFLIWVGPYAVQVIPKRAFSQGGVVWLRDTLAREVKGEAKTSRKRLLRLVITWLVLVIVFLVIWQLLASAPKTS